MPCRFTLLMIAAFTRDADYCFAVLLTPRAMMRYHDVSQRAVTLPAMPRGDAMLISSLMMPRQCFAHFLPPAATLSANI